MGVNKNMSESSNILVLMVKDHCKIEELINNLEQNIEKDAPKVAESFDRFEWNLEKHIFIEEKAIFTSYNPEDIIEGYKMLPELTKQHNILLNKLDLMRKDVRKKRDISDITSFKEFLLNHKNFEEKNVYPKLNESLDEKQKRLIIKRVNEII